MLRAQISPHFVYNSLTAIASFVRTDPDRARDLLIDFADFTRYSFRSHGRFTTLAEELHSIEQYLLLEQALLDLRQQPGEARTLLRQVAGGEGPEQQIAAALLKAQPLQPSEARRLSEGLHQGPLLQWYKKSVRRVWSIKKQ